MVVIAMLWSPIVVGRCFDKGGFIFFFFRNQNSKAWLIDEFFFVTLPRNKMPMRNETTRRCQESKHQDLEVHYKTWTNKMKHDNIKKQNTKQTKHDNFINATLSSDQWPWKLRHSTHHEATLNTQVSPLLSTTVAFHNLWRRDCLCSNSNEILFLDDHQECHPS